MEIRFTLTEKSVEIDGRSWLGITASEVKILRLLIELNGTILTKRQVFSALYGAGERPTLKTLDVFVCKLRQKLPAEAAQAIKTAWGRGYYWSPGNGTPEGIRMTFRRKQEIIELADKLDAERVATLLKGLGVSAGELEEWKMLFKRGGVYGLRVSKQGVVL